MRRAAGWQMPPAGHPAPRHCISQGLNAFGHADRIGEGSSERCFRAPGDGTADACLRSRMAAKLIRLAPPDASRPVTISWAAGLALLVAMAIALFVWGWIRGSDARVLARLPAEERARLFQLTRNKAEAVCASPDLENQCRAEVELLSEFPECGADCHAFVVQHRPRASR